MFNAIILAADDGNKINSAKSVFLYEISFQPLLKWVVDATADAEKKLLIANREIELIKDIFGNSFDYYEKNEFFSLQGVDFFVENNEDILVITGNLPIITQQTITDAYNFHKKTKNTVTVIKTAESCAENNYRVFFINSNELLSALRAGITLVDDILNYVCNKNLKNEFFSVDDGNELFAVNNNIQLLQAQKIMNEKIVNKHLLNGVLFLSTESVFIGRDVQIERDTLIMPNTIIKGKTSIGSNCIVGPNTQITDSEITNNVEINSSVVLESFIDENTKIGPFAYIRPHCRIGKNIKIGDFVEIKNATIDDGTKVSHLTYVGDADVGKKVNFGCGTVLVNYDGAYKYRSTIEDNAFIGCNTNLVSPVTVKENAFIAAGSTITDDVPENSLAIARARQVVKTDWKRKTKK